MPIDAAISKAKKGVTPFVAPSLATAGGSLNKNPALRRGTREAFSAVQKAFADNDIPFARKQVLVHVPEAEAGEMTPEQRQHIERAAAGTIEEEEKKAGQPAAAAGGAMP